LRKNPIRNKRGKKSRVRDKRGRKLLQEGRNLRNTGLKSLIKFKTRGWKKNYAFEGGLKGGKATADNSKNTRKNIYGAREPTTE